MLQPGSIYGVAATILVALTACGGLDAVDTTADYDARRIDCDERTPALDYDNFGRGFMAKNCTGCHHAEVTGSDRKGAPDTVNLDNEEDVAVWGYVAHVRTIGDSATMPPGGGLTSDELFRFDEWMTCAVLADTL